MKLLNFRCEYMQTDDETSQAQIEGVFSLLPELTGGNSLLGGLGGLFGTGNSAPARPPPNRFRPQGPTRFGQRPQRPPFRRPPFRPRPPPNCGIICKRRRKREARQARQIQYNILRYSHRNRKNSHKSEGPLAKYQKTSLLPKW